jgi:type II secretory pathway component PulK
VSPSRANLRAKRAFALPAVLAVTAIVTLVFLVAILALDSLVDQTRRAVELGRFQTQALSLEAHAAYAAAIGAPTATGLAVPGLDRRADPWLAIDGRPYQPASAPTLQLSMQDEAGLINLNNLSQPSIARLVEALDVPVDRRAALVDRFSDYVDLDDLSRVDGAEAAAYRDRGLPAPPNGPRRDIDQTLGVLGWKEAVPRERWRDLRDDMVADPTSSAININTATPAALRVLFGFSDDQLSTLLARRRAALFKGLEDLGRAAGVRLSGDAERVYGFPNGRFALKITVPETDMTYRSRIVLTPRDRERPVWIENSTLSLTPAKGKAEPLTDAPLLPAPVFPDPAPSPADPGRPLRDAPLRDG